MTSPAERQHLHVPRRAKTAESEPKLLEDWRALDAYVLLGDPGAGKSESFLAEAETPRGRYVKAGDFIAGIERPAFLPSETLFIDGLDEVRAGAADPRAPFDLIRKRLHELGRPRFRLSCREAAWQSERDAEALKLVAPNEKLEVLHLEPLDRADILAVLCDRSDEVPNAAAFLQNAERAGLLAMLGNPLLLDLTIKSAAAGDSHESRHEIYKHACQRLGAEHSSEHRTVKPPKPGDIDGLLDDAGLLCALMLLSNKTGLIVHSADGKAGLLDLSRLPESLPLRDAQAALASKVFITINGESTPRHRTIAEYLGARALARRIHTGLPLGRVLALMQGFDGKPVDSLGGLFGWLAVHDAQDRALLIRLDPLAIVLNGDVAAFTTAERVQVLEALRDEAERDRWFRRDTWVSHPFGPLATADMLTTYQELLSDHDPSHSHQVFIDCVLDALTHGERMSPLAPALEAWVDDSTASIGNRRSAYVAWCHHTGFLPAKAREWLDRFHASEGEAEEDKLEDQLLHDLYPESLGPEEVLGYLRLRKRHGYIDLSDFWDYALLEQSRPQDFAVLADAWVQGRSDWATDRRKFASRKLRSKLLAAALAHAGDSATNERLYEWLGIGLDEHQSSALDQELAPTIRSWLEARPNCMKAVVALGYERIAPDPQGFRPFWEAEQRLHGARHSPDWLWWLLDQASDTSSEALAKHCFDWVAWAAIDVPPGYDVPRLQDIERWVKIHSTRWPAADQWRKRAWSMDRDAWQGAEFFRERKHKAEELNKLAARREAMEPHWPTLRSGKPPPGLMHDLALSHNERYLDIKGDSGLDRVQNYLVCDIGTAQDALAAIDRVLERDDLPSVDDVLAQEGKGKGSYYLQEPALLAAKRLHERDQEAVLALAEGLIKLLVAFYLVNGTGEMPDWYKLVVERKPEIVAPILIRYVAPKLRRKSNTFVAGLWSLSREPSHVALTRLVLPALLEGFPLRANEPNRNHLNRSLLAALRLLDDGEAVRIVRRKLDQPSLDAAQRICWLVADLPYRVEAIERLAEWVGKNERRAVMLGVALYEQPSLERTLHRLPPSAVCALIEVLAPFTPQDRRLGMVITSGVAHDREDTVRGLFTALSSNPSDGARDALACLRASPRLGQWQSTADYSIRAQRATAREAQFQTPEPAEVAQTLAGLAPATAADLQALVVDHLADIERHLRHTDAYLVRQFWQWKLHKPLDENACRDLLLTTLRERLKPLGIHLHSEQRAAADKRADMVASVLRAGRRVALPIEVKKDSHSKDDHTNLWLAWRDQLQALYATDPAAGGYGVYLVLWFGIKPRSDPEGIKPTSPEHLRELLVARIPEVDRARLTVVVFDLSMPG